MATIPSFSPFSVHADEQLAGPRWRKWIYRFENLLCALDINDYRKKKAMLFSIMLEKEFMIYLIALLTNKGDLVQ